MADSLADLLMDRGHLGGSSADPSADPNATQYYSPAAVTQQYRLADALRNQRPATSWAGIAANALGAIGGNLVQGSANNALQSNQALRQKSLQTLSTAKDLPTGMSALLSNQDPALQNVGVEAKIKQLSDDPEKAYRVRASQAQQYGLQPQTQEYRDFVLTGKLPGMTGEGPYGKAGAIFQNPTDGKFYSVQFGADGKKLIEPVMADGSALTPARGVTQIGDELVDKSTGGTVRNVAPQIAGKEKAAVIGKNQGEIVTGAPKAAATMASLERQWNLVDNTIDKAVKQVDSGWTTGSSGSLLSSIPGTPAYDLRATLETIKANIGFDKLQEMRANSPTGGALGNVSDAENALLQSVNGALKQGQSKEQIKENLADVKANLAAVRRQKREAFQQTYGAAPTSAAAATGNTMVPEPGGVYEWTPNGGLKGAQ